MKISTHTSTGDPERIRHAHAVRKAVFQDEQGISSDLDFDSEDVHAFHVVAYDGERPVGTVRVRFPYSPDQAKLERLAVLSELRGMNIGGQILFELEKYLIELKVAEIIMNSQLSARGFYEKHGYVAEGDVFEEAHIKHIKMKKKLKK